MKLNGEFSQSIDLHLIKKRKISKYIHFSLLIQKFEPLILKYCRYYMVHEKVLMIPFRFDISEELSKSYKDLENVKYLGSGNPWSEERFKQRSLCWQNQTLNEDLSLWKSHLDSLSQESNRCNHQSLNSSEALKDEYHLHCWAIISKNLSSNNLVSGVLHIANLQEAYLKKMLLSIVVC